MHVSPLPRAAIALNFIMVIIVVVVVVMSAVPSSAAPPAPVVESTCGAPPLIADDATVRASFEQARTRPAKTSGVDKPYRVVCRFHVIRSASGASDFDLERIDHMMRDLNVGYRNTPFVFVREPGVEFIDRDDWYEGFPDFQSMIPLLEQYYEPGVISWYVVPSVRGGLFPASVWYGPPYTAGKRGVLMDASLLGQPTNIATPTHEIGHLFGLLHPYETAFGVECTSGSNCQSAGDLLCDTAATTALWAANTTGTGVYFADEPGPCADDPTYDPDATLYMGAGWSAGHILRDKFSGGQLGTMNHHLLRDQNDLIGVEAPAILVDCDHDQVDDIDAILEGRVLDHNLDMVPDHCQTRAQPGDLVVVGMTSDLGNRPRFFDPDTGELRGELWNGLPWTHQVRLGPDGLLYLPTLSMVARVDLATGRTREILVDGILDGARLSVDVAFDSEGGLLVLDNNDSKIRRFDRASGEQTGVFADLRTVGMTTPKAMIRDPHGHLLVVGNGSLGDSVQRVDGVTGTVLAPLVPPGGGHLQGGQGLLIDGGELLIADSRGSIEIFRLADGAWLRQLVAPGAGGLAGPHGLVIDGSGHLLVACRGGNSVKRYDRQTGAHLGDAITAGSSGLLQPTGLLLVPRVVGVRPDPAVRGPSEAGP